MVVNTTSGRTSIRDSYSIRRQTLQAGIPYFTNFSAAQAATGALEALRWGPLGYRSLQEYTGSLRARRKERAEARVAGDSPLS